MKNKYFLYTLTVKFLFLFIILLNINCSTKYTKEDSPRNWKYFNIYASSEDNIIFVQLQDDLGISPKMERYLLTVNILEKNNQYVILGGESNPSSKKFVWSNLRKTVQQGLLNWTGSNKEKLE
ncbi:MAG: hypothetical protein NTU73_05070 [Ignavibacteriae bacterium]|nr:hypothetical protein [Ignavibacteriota bacterium]